MIPYLALYSWPVIAFVIFRKRELAVAVTGCIVAGFLLLPPNVAVDLPMLPAINKGSVASLSAFIVAAFILRKRGYNQPAGPTVRRPVGLLPRSPFALLLLGLLVGGTFMTVVTNLDPLFYGPRRVPALRFYDAFSQVLTMIMMMLPFLLARKYLADPESHKKLLLVLCIAGLIYTLPALYEVRMSPQLNLMFYGFRASSFLQHIRGDGFRPMVFLSHGLGLGLFFSMAFLAALICLKTATAQARMRFLMAAVWIFGTLVLSKTLGPLLLALLAAPLILFLGVRLQLICAAVIVSLVLAYPLMRGAGLIPVERSIALAEKIDYGRARSLEFRLLNEEQLLDKASQRPLFGWGPQGRMRVYDEEGYDISVTDGRWIISIGMGGWVRYLAEFGILGFSVIFLALRARRFEVDYATSGICVMLAVNMIDLIPNAGLTPITWLMAGALLGRLELGVIPKTGAREVEETLQSPERRTRYSRPRGAPPSGDRQNVYTRSFK